VLRGVGRHRGPVLRPNRRRRSQGAFEGIDRRAARSPERLSSTAPG